MTTVASLRKDLQALLAEQTEIPRTAAEARTAGDANAWLRLQARADELVDELQAARRSLLPHDLEAAWVAAEKLHKVERELFEAHEVAWREWKEHAETSARAVDADADARIDSRALGAKLRERSQRATAAWRASRAETASALRRVDELEERCAAACAELPAGAGLRAPVGTLTLAVHVDDPDTGHSVCFLGGTTPPRWAAHLLGPHAFEEKPARAVHSTESTSMQVGRDGVAEYQSERRTWA